MLPGRSDCNDVHGHFWKFTFFISAMKRGSERSESKILSILRKIHSPLIANPLVSPLRDANSAGRGERVNTRGDIDAVAKHRVVGEQNIAEMNPDAHLSRVDPGLRPGTHARN